MTYLEKLRRQERVLVGTLEGLQRRLAAARRVFELPTTPCASVEDSDARAFILEAFLGAKPDGAVLVHKCGDPTCAAADHALYSTRSDAQAWSTAAGRARPRGASGRRVPAAALERRIVEAEESLKRLRVRIGFYL